MNGPVAVAKLISMLLLAIAGYTGFAVPKQHPEITFLPRGELQERFCGWPCPIRAFFPPGSTIYLEQGLDIAHDPAKLNHGPLVASCPSVDSGRPAGSSDSALAKSPASPSSTLAGYGG